MEKSTILGNPLVIWTFIKCLQCLVKSLRAGCFFMGLTLPVKLSEAKYINAQGLNSFILSTISFILTGSLIFE